MADPQGLALAGKQAFDKGLFAQALNNYQAAVATLPHAALFTQLALCQQKLANQAAALNAFQQAYRVADATQKLGTARNVVSQLLAMRRDAEAVQFCSESPLASDESLPSLLCKARLSLAVKDQQARLENLTRIVQLRSGVAADHIELADAQLSLGDDASALASLETALRLQSDSPLAWLRWGLCCPPIPADQQAILDARARLSAALSKLQALQLSQPQHPEWGSVFAQSAFYLSYQGLNDRPLFERLQSLQRLALSQLTQLHRLSNQPRSNARIKVGFFSSNLHQHTISRYFGSWITALDRSQFETVVIHNGEKKDSSSEALKSQCDQYVDATLLPDLIDGIADLQLDLLIYLDVGMVARQQPLLSYRLAPVQCAAWGHPVTTGAAEIDCYFSCELMEPADYQAHYTETVRLLPNLGTSFTPQQAALGLSRADLGLPTAGQLLLVPQSLFKIHPDCDRLFAEILIAHPAASLVLFNDKIKFSTAQFKTRLQKALSEQGLNLSERSVFLPTTDHARFAAINAACDLMLDTLHWSGGNTALDALANDLPIVSLPGEFMRGRQTLGMYHTIDFTDLIAQDRKDYLSLVNRYLTDTNFAAHCKQQIQQNKHKLFNDLKPIRALEQHLIDLHEQSQKSRA
jgi:predicted O-linked N-acetylglucosamine transferase (SPINDLY family)